MTDRGRKKGDELPKSEMREGNESKVGQGRRDRKAGEGGGGRGDKDG